MPKAGFSSSDVGNSLDAVTHEIRSYLQTESGGYIDFGSTNKTAAGLFVEVDEHRYVLSRCHHVSGQEEGRIAGILGLPSVWDLDAKLEWVVQDFIAVGSVTLLSGESSTGKSWLAHYIAGCVAHGRACAGRPVRQQTVLYVDGENPLYVVKRNLRELGIERSPDLRIWGGWNGDLPPGPCDPMVIDFARKYRPLIIYDSLLEFHSGSEQSASETRQYMRHYRHLANVGASVLLLTNTGKSENSKQYRGSSDIKAAVDTAYLLETVGQNAGKLGRLTVKCFKGRLAPGQSFGIEFQQGSGFTSFDLPNQVAGRSPEEVVREILVSHPGSNQKYVVTAASKLSLSKHQVEECLRTGPWVRASGAGREIRYSLKESLEEVVI